jgi:very-short-patch-repair endonuclease
MGVIKMYYRTLARKLRKKPTEAEAWLWQHLRLRQLSDFKFRRQHPLGNYVVDFICLEAKLIVEVDGGQHNLNGDIKKDIVRTKWLEQKGFKVLRFWNNDVLGNILSVKEAIWTALMDYPHPNLPPGRGKEQYVP